MAYLGRQPIIGNYQVLDAIVATTTDTYALTKDAVAVFPQTSSNCIVSLNGVIQAPVGSYTISGSNIVFDSALTGTDSIDFITVLGDVLSIGTPTDGTVTTAKLADSSVTTAKLNDGSVSLAKLTATGTKDATTFLRGDNTFASASGKFESQLLHVRDEKSSGTGGGTLTSGAWRTRTLNTSLTNEISGASLSSNQITLPSGTYFINAIANVGANSQSHKAKLANITDTSDTVIGTSEFNEPGSGSTKSFVIGRFTIGAEKVFELQHRSGNTTDANGFGVSSGFSVVEVYADVQIWKVA
jgi:hypothetical protein